MEQYVINQHPFKITVEYDDEWLRSVNVGVSDIDELLTGWDCQMKEMAIGLHAVKAQLDATKDM